MKHVLANVGEVVTDTPVKITITVKPQGFAYRLAQKLWLLPKSKVFYVSQITVGNLLRISKLLTEINSDPKEAISQFYKATVEYAPIMIKAVAIGLYNRKAEPPDSLYQFIEHNVTTREMMDVLSVIVNRMNTKDFISSIILTGGLNLLEMSRDLKGSQIAPGTLSEGS